VNIAFVTPEYTTEANYHGGLANYLSRVAHGLLGLGHRPIVIVGSDGGGNIEDRGVSGHRVRVAAPWEKILAKVPAVRRADTALKWLWQSRKLNDRLLGLHSQEHIDIVQYASYTATALFRIKSIPSVVRVSSVQETLDIGYNRRKTLPRRLLHLLDIRSMKNADRIIAPSTLIAREVERMTGRPVTVIESPYVAPDGPLDDRPFQDLLAGRLYLLTFGSLGTLKGIDTVAEIVHGLLEAHPRLYYVFVGKDMGFQGRPMMQHVWEKAGRHRARVLYLGIMPPRQLYPIIQGARLTVLPSKVDNLPNTCIEAMAMGRVVIGTRGASFEQLIEDGVSGFLCTIGDPECLRKTIDKALALDESDLLLIGQRAAQRIERMSPETVVGELLDFYREVLDRTEHARG